VPPFRIYETRAALDCDGVLVNFDSAFSKVATHVLKRPVEKLNNRYELTMRYGLSDSDFKYAWDALDDHQHGWSGMEVLPGAVEAVQTLRRQGLSIHLVTGIEGRLSETRLANLLANAIEVESIDCVGNGVASKASVMQRLGPVLFVEDRLRLLHESDFIPNRAWVDHGDDQDGHVLTAGITRVDSLKTWVDVHWTPGLHTAPSRRGPRP